MCCGTESLLILGLGKGSFCLFERHLEAVRESVMAPVLRCERPTQRRHLTACKRQKTHKWCWIAPVFPHMLSSSSGKGTVSSLPTGFLLIQLVFTALLGRKSLHISTTLSWTKDVHSPKLSHSTPNDILDSHMESLLCVKTPPDFCALTAPPNTCYSASYKSNLYIFIQNIIVCIMGGIYWSNRHHQPGNFHLFLTILKEFQ